jgi:uncharacterized membrane protein
LPKAAISVLAKQKGEGKEETSVMRKEATILAAAAAVGSLLALSTSTADALGYTFTDINVPGSQPGSTGNFNGISINNLGQIAGTYIDSAGNFDGFLYTGGKYVTLNAPGATGTFLEGINDLGQVVGTAFYSNGTSQNFIDTHGKFTVISDAISPLPENALNDKDEVLGSFGFSNYGVLNAHGVISPIDASGNSISVSGFNNLGQLAGTLSDSAGCCEAFIDTNGAFTKFEGPNAVFTNAGGINDWGQVVGEYFDDQNNGYGYLYTNGRFTAIQDPNASPEMGGTQANNINDLGEIVGWYFDAQGDIHSFLATPNLGLFALATAAPLADPVPEPSTWAMMLLGFAGLGWLAHLRRRNLTAA